MARSPGAVQSTRSAAAQHRPGAPTSGAASPHRPAPDCRAPNTWFRSQPKAYPFWISLGPNPGFCVVCVCATHGTSQEKPEDLKLISSGCLCLGVSTHGKSGAVALCAVWKWLKTMRPLATTQRKSWNLHESGRFEQRFAKKGSGLRCLGYFCQILRLHLFKWSLRFVGVLTATQSQF